VEKRKKDYFLIYLNKLFFISLCKIARFCLENSVPLGRSSLLFFLQKSFAKKEKLRKELKEKRLYIDSYNKSICPNCKNTVNYNKNYYGYCREELNRVCKECKSRTPKNIEYCLECGSSED